MDIGLRSDVVIAVAVAVIDVVFLKTANWLHLNLTLTSCWDTQFVNI